LKDPKDQRLPQEYTKYLAPTEKYTLEKPGEYIKRHGSVSRQVYYIVLITSTWR